MATRAKAASNDSDLRPASAAVLDFTNVKDRGAFNPKRKPPGDYKAKIVKVEETTSQAENKMWVFTVTITGDSQASYPYRCVLNENNAWKVRNLFMACGMNVPKKKLRVDPNKAVNKELGVTLEDDEYEGKVKSVISATFPVSELPAQRKATRAAATTDDEEVDEEEEEVEDEDEMEVDEVDDL